MVNVLRIAFLATAAVFAAAAFLSSVAAMGGAGVLVFGASAILVFKTWGKPVNPFERVLYSVSSLAFLTGALPAAYRNFAPESCQQISTGGALLIWALGIGSCILMGIAAARWMQPRLKLGETTGVWPTSLALGGFMAAVSAYIATQADCTRFDETAFILPILTNVMVGLFAGWLGAEKVPAPLKS